MSVVDEKAVFPHDDEDFALIQHYEGAALWWCRLEIEY